MFRVTKCRVKWKRYIVAVNIKFTLEQATKVQRGIEVKLYSFFNLGSGWGWVVNAKPRPLYPLERPGTHCTGG